MLFETLQDQFSLLKMRIKQEIVICHKKRYFRQKQIYFLRVGEPQIIKQNLFTLLKIFIDHI